MEVVSFQLHTAEKAHDSATIVQEKVEEKKDKEDEEIDTASEAPTVQETDKSDETTPEVTEESKEVTISEGDRATGASKGEEEMEVEGEKMVVGEEKEKGGEGKESEDKKEPEPNFEVLSNPARVLPRQVSPCTTTGIRLISSHSVKCLELE